MRFSLRSNRQYNEYIVLAYRLILIMAFYSLLRLLFYFFNTTLFPNVNLFDFLTIMKGGLMFDLSAMLYLNFLYILIYFLSLQLKFRKGYQRFLKIFFVSINSIGFALNSIDIIYYRFILKRTTYNVFSILENEKNMLKLSGRFLIDYWHIAVLFILIVIALSKAYSLLEPKKVRFSRKWIYPVVSFVALVVFSGFSIVGMRGGYRHSTRPINMANAGKYVNTPDEMALVLNTPFSIIRTWDKKNFTSYDFFDDKEELESVFSPVIQPDTSLTPNKKNVVIFMLESFNREYIGAVNKHLDNGNYKGYTPFLDSLIQHSLVFPNAFANGRKSIDALPSVIAGIPALVLPYVVSEYSSNKINSLPSVLNNFGYETAFFHGAHNGSMGFDSFAKMAGFQKYFGLTEYNNDDDFDGMWGIWDEPFFQFFADEMNKLQEPFMTSLFSVSSHHPFKVPEKYKNVFPKGTLPVHESIAYTDNALRKFINKAKTMPWYENTLFVITADHSSASHYRSSRTSLNKFQVPLLFFSPGDSTLNGVKQDIAQQIDIMPTILHYLGFNTHSYITFGNDLIDSNDERYVINYTNDCYQLYKDNYLIHYNGENLISVYNTEEDPLLTNNIKDNEKGYLDNLRFMQAIIQQYNNRMIEDRLTVE